MLVRRDCYARVGQYSPRFSQSGEDWDMWLRIALHFDLAYTATPLAKYRYHDHSSSAISRLNGTRLRNDRAIIQSIWRNEAVCIPDRAALRKKANAALAVKALQIENEQFT